LPKIDAFEQLMRTQTGTSFNTSRMMTLLTVAKAYELNNFKIVHPWPL